MVPPNPIIGFSIIFTIHFNFGFFPPIFGNTHKNVTFSSFLFGQISETKLWSKWYFLHGSMLLDKVCCFLVVVSDTRLFHQWTHLELLEAKTRMWDQNWSHHVNVQIPCSTERGWTMKVFPHCNGASNPKIIFDNFKDIYIYIFVYLYSNYIFCDCKETLAPSVYNQSVPCC